MEVEERRCYKKIVLPYLTKINHPKINSIIEQINKITQDMVDKSERIQILKNQYSEWIVKYDEVNMIAYMTYGHKNNSHSTTKLQVNLKDDSVSVNVNIYPMHGFYYGILESNGVFNQLMQMKNFDDLIKNGININKSIRKSEAEYLRYEEALFYGN